MPRVLLLSWLVFATHPSPAQAAAERAAVAVSLKVEPSCAVGLAGKPRAEAGVTVTCAMAPDARRPEASPESPAYTVRTIRRDGDMVHQFDF